MHWSQVSIRAAETSPRKVRPKNSIGQEESVRQEAESALALYCKVPQAGLHQEKEALFPLFPPTSIKFSCTLPRLTCWTQPQKLVACMGLTSGSWPDRQRTQPQPLITDRLCCTLLHSQGSDLHSRFMVWAFLKTQWPYSQSTTHALVIRFTLEKNSNSLVFFMNESLLRHAA
jgi:hypothetical protein